MKLKYMLVISRPMKFVQSFTKKEMLCLKTISKNRMLLNETKMQTK